jgi:hypothetical protein
MCNGEKCSIIMGNLGFWNRSLFYLADAKKDLMFTKKTQIYEKK